MAQYSFGAGIVIGKRQDLANTPPAFLGVLQDISLDFDQSLKTLLGQYKVPVALAGAELKITGKAKHAQIRAANLDNLFFGQGVSVNSQVLFAGPENHAVPSTPFQVTVANGATFVEDLGVFYHNTGVQLQPVSANPGVGQYIAGALNTGTYTLNSSDSGQSLDFFYSYTATSGNTISMANQLMGAVPVFSIQLSEQFKVFGAPKTLVIKLNACSSSKLSFPFKNQDFTIMEMDFQAQADVAGNIGLLSVSE